MREPRSRPPTLPTATRPTAENLPRRDFPATSSHGNPFRNEPPGAPTGRTAGTAPEDSGAPGIDASFRPRMEPFSGNGCPSGERDHPAWSRSRNRIELLRLMGYERIAKDLEQPRLAL